MTITVTCPSCHGAYSGPHTHAHTDSEIINDLFTACPTCHGKGAQSCSLCEGCGMVTMTPAHDVAAAKNNSRLSSMEPTSRGLTPHRPTEYKSDERRVTDIVRIATETDFGVQKGKKDGQ